MVIDFHLHIGDFRGPGAEARLPMTWENQLARLDEEGIDKAVFLPVYNSSPEGAPFAMVVGERASLREQVLDACRYPARIISFGNVDPRWGANSPDTDFGPVLDWFQEHGCRGVGEITANVPFDDPRNVNMFRQLGERGLLVTIESTDMAPSSRYGYRDEPGSPRLERLLELAPGTIVIGHGPGFWADMAAGISTEDKATYPSGPILAEGATPRLLRAYPNLFADLSARSGFNAISRDLEYALRFLEELQDKLLFGTDVCFADAEGRMPQLDFLKGLLAEGKLSQQAFDKITWRNGMRLLGEG